MSFLQTYDAAPDADKANLVRGWIDSDPLAFFAELRTERPIFESALATLVARFPDVIEVLSHPTVFPVKLYVPKMHDFMLATDNEASHQRDKSVMQAMLNMDDAPKVREMVGRFADEALNGGERPDRPGWRLHAEGADPARRRVFRLPRPRPRDHEAVVLPRAI